MPVPIWLLDIDGVLNAVGGSQVYRNKWGTAPWRRVSMRVGEEGPFLIRVAEPVIEFVRDVHEKGLAEIRWHTTWRTEAQKLADWLDLPAFPVHQAPEYLFRHARGTWWKLPGARRVVEEEEHHLLWTDDEIRYEVKPGDPVIYRPENLIITTDDRYGLSPDDLKRIKEYLEKER